MTTMPAVRACFALLSAALLTGCGGPETTPDAAAAMPQDTFIKPIEREPLTEADLVGFEMTQLALELPWTRNKVSRDAAAGAPATAFLEAEITGHEGFDRVTFTLDDVMANVGYEIRFAAAGERIPCGTAGHDLTGTNHLVVAFTPARADGSGVSTGTRSTGASRLARAGVVCAEGDALVWIAELGAGDQVRVLELRDPARIAVDVR